MGLRLQSFALSPHLRLCLPPSRLTIFQVSADEILFKGYVDPILGEVCKKPIISAFCGTAIPERIGIFYGVTF